MELNRIIELLDYHDRTRTIECALQSMPDCMQQEKAYLLRRRNLYRSRFYDVIGSETGASHAEILAAFRKSEREPEETDVTEHSDCNWFESMTVAINQLESSFPDTDTEDQARILSDTLEFLISMKS